MSGEGVSNNRAIVHDQQLLNFRSQIGDGSAKVLRCFENTTQTSWPSRRERAIDESPRKRRFRVAYLALIPKGRISPAARITGCAASSCLAVSMMLSGVGRVSSAEATAAAKTAMNDSELTNDWLRIIFFGGVVVLEMTSSLMRHV